MFNPTIAGITLRALLGRKRVFLLALPAAVLLIITLALKADHAASTSWPAEVLGRVGFSALLPLTALIIGTSVLGAEIDDSSILHLLATPVRRESIVLTKAVVAAGVTMLFAAVPEFVAALIASGRAGAFAFGLGLGAVLGSIVYTAVFVLISTVTRHPVAFALAYVAVWEGVVTNLVSGAKYLSAEQYSLALANSVAKDDALDAHLTVGTALVLAAIATVATLAAAGNRLRSFTLTGDA
ncbi:ABC transporter permease [Actinocrinis puniceicyclus]|uniref:ABC transporter permease n=1 Tax=Actinocrinis puniceicyclus TaxID=977794 RepID=A0A8J7WQH1_9ACTN|nr:ABC transporter permease [Actinocrinis puniceicyclus]MBS2964527.1 ABC transporter permease [Actinocrinis puniceicyclus]